MSIIFIMPCRPITYNPRSRTGIDLGSVADGSMKKISVGRSISTSKQVISIITCHNGSLLFVFVCVWFFFLHDLDSDFDSNIYMA